MSKKLESTYTSVLPVADIGITPTPNLAGTETGLSEGLTLTIPDNASGIIMQADVADVRFTFDGTDPTSTSGFILHTYRSIRLDLYPGCPIKLYSNVGIINYQFIKYKRGIH